MRGRTMQLTLDVPADAAETDNDPVMRGRPRTGVPEGGRKAY